MATYKVTLISETDNINTTIDCNDFLGIINGKCIF